MKTEVAIIGAGLAGLLLGHLLRAEGIACVILERQTREHVGGRIRAGVLETVTTDLLRRLGINAGLNANGMVEDGFNLATDDHIIRIDIKALTGKHFTVYGQTEITRDLIAAAPDRNLPTLFEAKDVAIHDVDSAAPYLTYTSEGVAGRIDASFIAGCDGFHGPSRKAIPNGREFERAYPFGWLGILADVPPRTDLRQHSRRLRARLDALADAQPLLYPGAADRARRGLARGPGVGRTGTPLHPPSPTVRWSAAPHWKSRSRRCDPMCSRRCATAGCSWPATPRTSYRRPARRA